MVVLNGTTRLARCALAASIGCKCQGWSTATLVGAAVSILTGEIIEMVKFEDITEILGSSFDIEQIKNWETFAKVILSQCRAH